ncbi:hypothetical protein [Salipaludibacillus sp. CF4.18]|uniref:hypothetical protein n=1 Tax=Salipaludibacillus sp. CF4.18 TaxID=3373081 RepID=UPI003EE77F5B
MIPIEVENRIAKYFFHHFHSEEIMEDLITLLLPQCLEVDDEEELDQDELVRQAISMLRSIRGKEH